MLDALQNQLGDAGYRVFDETALTMENFVQDRCRRTDQELIDVARSLDNPPIDVIVLFRIFAGAEQLDYTTKVQARVTGRLLDPHSGQRLGNFEFGKGWTVSTECNRNCVVESVRERTELLAADLGAAIALQHGVGGGTVGEPAERIRQYVLVFDNFTSEDIARVEGYLQIFSCYDSHRPTEMSARHARYSYWSCIDPAKLSSNLNRMMQELQEDAGGTFNSIVNMDGNNNFTVRKIVLRNQRPRVDDGYQW